MLDLHPSALDTRIHEHDLRVRRANREGWRLSSTDRSRQKIGIGAILETVVARFAPSATAREVKGVVTSIDALATGNGARSLA